MSETEKPRSPLVVALEARAKDRPIEIIDAAEFCSPTSALAGLKVGLRVAYKAEEMAALVAAEHQARKSGGDSPITDRAYNVDNRTLHILCEVVRNGESLENARVFPMFDSPQHLAKLLTGDETAKLLNRYNALALKHSPSEQKIDTETVDGYVEAIANVAGTDAATLVLSRMDRTYLEHFVQLVCVRLEQAEAQLDAQTNPMKFVPLDDTGEPTPEGPATLATEAGIK